MSAELFPLPVTVHPIRAHGVHGKFRYEGQVLTHIAGQPALEPGLLHEIGQPGVAKVVEVPEIAVPQLQSYAELLAAGSDQYGLLTGERLPDYNCASFVHDALGVPYPRSSIGTQEGIGAWSLEPMQVDWQPEPGEVVVYQRPHSGNWVHWGIGVGGELPGVLGVNGANGHSLMIASSPDLAKGFGHTEPYRATPLL